MFVAICQIKYKYKYRRCPIFRDQIKDNITLHYVRRWLVWSVYTLLPGAQEEPEDTYFRK